MLDGLEEGAAEGLALGADDGATETLGASDGAIDTLGSKLTDGWSLGAVLTTNLKQK